MVRMKKIEQFIKAGVRKAVTNEINYFAVSVRRSC